MKKLIILLPILFLLVMTSCNSDDSIDTDAYIKDDAGNLLDRNFHPKKIISLAPNITETIYALNADSLLVGVTDFCDYPPQAKSKEKIGTLLDPNLEKITALSPDIIFMTTEGNSKYTYLSLKNNGFRVFVVNPNDISGINRMIVNFGIILNKKDTGKRLAEYIEDKRKYYELEGKNKQKTSSLLIISVNPLITVNKFTYISEILGLAGFENIYGDELLEYPNVTYEDVIIKNPDYIFYLTDTTNKSTSNELLMNIKSRLNIVNAVKNNKVYDVDENVFSRPGPRVMDCVKIMNDKIQ